METFSLTTLQKNIIQMLELNARLSLDTLADELQVSKEVLEKNMTFLEREHIIQGSNTVINIAKLGLTGYAFFITLHNKKTAAKIIDFALHNPAVFWVCEIDGTYDLIMAVQTRDNVALAAFMQIFMRKYAQDIKNYEMAIRTEVNHFPRTYLKEKKEQSSQNTVFFGRVRPQEVILSQMEKSILYYLSDNAQISVDCLAEQLATTTSIITKTIARLEKYGVILGYHLLVHPEYYAYRVYQLLCFAGSATKKEMEALRAYCMNHPHITVFVEALGKWNLEITCEVTTQKEGENLVKELKDAFDCINTIEIIKTNNYYRKYRLGYPSTGHAKEKVARKKIEDEDFFTLKEIVRRSEDDVMDFEYCPGYLLQACRNLPRVAYVGDNIAFYTKKSKAKNAPYVVVLVAGMNRRTALTKLCQNLYTKSKQPVIIKNIGKEEETPLLQEKYFRRYKTDEFWDDYARYDDNTYPQVVIRNKSLLEMKGKMYKNLREKLSWFQKRYSLEIAPYQETDKKVFHTLLRQWARNMSQTHGLDEKELFASHTMYGETKDFYYQYLVYEKAQKKYVGYISLSAISQNVCGYNALIHDFTVKELYKMMMYKGAEIANRLGFEYTNIQGSENNNQFVTKSWFVPERLQEKVHLVYDGE